MKRGVILEVRGNRAVVLTPEGRFVRVRCPEGAWRPGDELTWGRSPAAYLRPALALACLLVLLVPASLAYQAWRAPGPVVAYVSVDINPSLEFGIDIRERVCQARALNGDGEAILRGLAWRGRPLDAVVAEVAARALDAGYLGAGGTGAVLVTVTPAAPVVPAGAARGPEGTTPAAGTVPEEAGVSAQGGPAEGAPGVSGGALDAARVRDGAVRATLGALARRGVRATVKGLAASSEVREQARELGLSPGRLALYLAAREAGIEVDLEQFRRGRVAEILREAVDRQLGAEDRAPGGAGEEPAPSGAPGKGPSPETPAEGGSPGAPVEAAPGGQRAPASGGAVVGPGRGDEAGHGGQEAPRGDGKKPGAAPAGRGGAGAPAERPGGGESGRPGGGKGPGLKLGKDVLGVPADELVGRLWDGARLEQELPHLMKKFLPPGQKGDGQGRKDKPGGR